MLQNRIEGGQSFIPTESHAVTALRDEISLCFDQIDQRPELRQPVSSSLLTHTFPKIKQFKIQWAISEGLVSPIGDPRHNPKFDQTSIAMLLYWNELRAANPKVRKLARRLAQEEFAKREEQRKQRLVAGKVAFKPVPSY